MKKILCIGEILWDMLPSGKKAGGAPFNAACHLKQLGQEVSFASRIGNDELGNELRAVINHHGIGDNLIQIDERYPTGTVQVSFDRQNEPSYEITLPAAWDQMQLTNVLLEAAEKADILVFGSLAQRQPATESVIRELCRLPLFRVFDINLRPPFIDRTKIERSLNFADVLKLNVNELKQLSGWFGFSDDSQAAMSDLAGRFAIKMICLTRGAKGAALWKEGEWAEVDGITVDVVDTVGSGDAFLAGLISAYVSGKNLPDILSFANQVGAYVAGREGAIPDLDTETVRKW